MAINYGIDDDGCRYNPSTGDNMIAWSGSVSSASPSYHYIYPQKILDQNLNTEEFKDLIRLANMGWDDIHVEGMRPTDELRARGLEAIKVIFDEIKALEREYV
eukprot:CAMPEP_0205916518 /NCGR_PEP_ID=MMETSP1325-20131115/8557_1 /ASSEMBLY_ACC=CAM_ASM_000708 /TAXON_ID=236786 /ORGANISM="Florenciella sp., Strain RCC1007" /LENGTH=102 /DNA_ID=CAMNT_0053283805 /DNA_START=50 /DNA_END=355 /DNA_ORIENTATION=+